jgi:hypothetical protein
MQPTDLVTLNMRELDRLKVRSAEKSGRQHSVELRNGGTHESNPEGGVHERIS